MADDPEEDIDVKEEEGIGQQKWVMIAPCPNRRESLSTTGLVVEECEVEENGGKGS